MQENDFDMYQTETAFNLLKQLGEPIYMWKISEY